MNKRINLMKKLLTLVSLFVFFIIFQSVVYSKEEAEILIQTGHSNGITAITFSPDGHYALSGSHDETLRFWDIATHKLVRTFEGHTGSVNAVAFSKGGKQILSGSKDQTLRLWDLTTGKLVHTFQGHTDEVTTVAFSPDGQHILSGSGDGSLILWDRKTGRILHRPGIFGGHTDAVLAVAFSPDGQYILSGSEDLTIRLWNHATGELVRTFKRHVYGVSTVAFNPSGQQILSGSYDRILLWDLATGKHVRELDSYDSRIVTFSPDGKHVLSGSRDHTLSLLDLNTGQLLRKFVGHTKGILAVAFSPDGQRILSGGWDKKLLLWDSTTGQLLHAFEDCINPVRTVTFSPNGKQILSGSRDHTLRLWDRATGQLVRTFKGHKGAVRSVVFRPDGQQFVSGSEDDTVRLWDRATGQLVRTFKGHTSTVFSVTFSPNGQQILSGSWDNTLRLWDRTSGQLLRTFEGHSRSVNAVAFSPDGVHVLSGSSDHTLRLWDKASGKLVRSFETHTAPVLAVAFSPEGKHLLSGSADRTLRLWDRAMGWLIHTFEGHIDPVLTVAFSPNGKQVLSGSTDHTLRLWNRTTGQFERAFEGHTYGVKSVAFSQDGRNLISGSGDGSIKLWERETGDNVVTLSGFKNGEWIAYTPDNYYVSSVKGDQYVTFRVGNKVYDFAQYANIYKKPEIVKKILQGKDLQSNIAAIRHETGVDLTRESIVDLVPPEVVVQFLKQGETLLEPANQVLEVPQILVVAKVIQRQHGVDRILLQVNDQTIYEQKINGRKEFELRTPIELKESTNNLKLVAWSTKQVKSNPRTLNLTYKAELMKGWSLPKITEYVFGKSKSWAVIIGISSYSKDKNGFKPLPHTVDDAEAIKSLFLNQLGFAEDHIISILDNDATKQRIETVLAEELPKKVGQNDRVIIYFSGHGHTRKTRKGDPYGYIVPVDGKKQSIHPTAISMDQMYSFSELIPAKQILFIVDACYSGIRGTLHKKGDLPEQTRQQVETFIKSGGRQIMTAGTANESVVMGPKWDGHSVYTYYLINGLKGSADYNKDGVTTVRELQVYLDDKVPNDAKQTPQLNYLGTGEGQFVFYQEGSF